ncbi:MAG: hypothetical protein M1826_002738 [Phylliscum demangeonii]|nr:MAG: hypothetical protein M1826_002738 [Phylliscum demangeonii]
MAYLSVEITPPLPGLPYADLSPAAFLKSSPVKRKIKQRLGCTMTDEDQRLLKYDLPPTDEDGTIVDFSNRQKTLLGPQREKLQVVLPPAFLGGMRRDLGALKQQVARQELENSTLRRQLDNSTNEQYILFRANIVVDLVKVVLAGKPKMSKKWQIGDHEGNEGHDTTRLLRAADSITQADLARVNLPAKYLPMIKKLREWWDGRNSAAHESEGPLARLLYSNPEYYEQFGSFYDPLYQVCYGKTLEEAANEPLEIDKGMGF